MLNWEPLHGVSLRDKGVFPNRQILTYIALFMLLIGRILAGDIVSNFLQLFNAPTLPSSWALGISWIHNLFLNWSFILVGIVIMINRSDLKSLNIDEPFVALFITGSLAYWTYYRWPSGWIVLLIPVAIYIFYKRQEFRFAKLEPIIAKQMTIMLVIGFLLGLLFQHDSLTIKNILWFAHLVATQFPFTLVEEVIFRGLLWKFLADLNWSAPKIVALQAFLFWLSHSHYMFTDRVFFWITIPIISIIMGVIVWRSRSITISLLAHLFYNFLF